MYSLEPTVGKVRFFTSSCLVMFAGDANLQSEIIQSAQSEINEKIRESPLVLSISGTVARPLKAFNCFKEFFGRVNLL